MTTEFEELLEKKERYDRAYYQLEMPLVTDDEYDALKGNLKEYARHMGFDVPEDTLHYLETKDAVTHPSRMYSLSCAVSSNTEKFRPLFKGNGKAIAEPKLDGVALNIIYLNNKLANAVTRGDHFKGESMLSKIVLLENVPKTESIHLDIYEIRGEVVIPKDKLAELNASRKKIGKPIYKTGRSAVAAMLRANDDSLLAAAGCQFIVYGMGLGKEVFADHQSMMRFLSASWETVPMLDELIWSPPIDATFESVKSVRDSYPYEIDGIVIKANDHAVQKELGYAGNDPKWAFAIKFNEAVGTTRVVDVSFSVGRTGAITATLHYDPVNLGGVTCSTAVIPSIEKLKAWNPAPGKEVQVMRAGDTIPYIVGMSSRLMDGFFSPPTACPSCGSELVIRGEETLICNNHDKCTAQVLALFHYQCSKKVLNFVGFGDKTRAKFVGVLAEAGLTEILDVWGVLSGGEKERKGYFLQTGLTENKIASVEVSLASLFRQPLWRVIAAAGFHGVAEGTCKKISAHYSNVSSLLKDIERGGLRNGILSDEKLATMKKNAVAMNWLYAAADCFTLIDDK